MINIQPAIDHYKTGAALARALNIDPMCITQWKKRGVPPDRIKDIAKVTNKAIKKQMIKELLED